MTSQLSNAGGHRSIGAMVACGVILLGLTGCTPQDGSHGMLSYSELNALYLEEAEDFPWSLPDSATFPSQIPMPERQNSIYEASNARAMAFFYWQCSWMGQFLENRNTNPDIAATALAQIKESVGAPYKDSFYDDSEGVWVRVVDNAEMGDVSEFSAFYMADCSTMKSN